MDLFLQSWTSLLWKASLVLKERLESALYSTTRRLEVGLKADGTSYEQGCWFSTKELVINKLFIMLKNWETEKGVFFSLPNARFWFILYLATPSDKGKKKPRLKQNWTKWCTQSPAVRTAPISTGGGETKQLLHRCMAQHGGSQS